MKSMPISTSFTGTLYGKKSAVVGSNMEKSSSGYTYGLERELTLEATPLLSGTVLMHNPLERSTSSKQSKTLDGKTTTTNIVTRIALRSWATVMSEQLWRRYGVLYDANMPQLISLFRTPWV